MSKATNVSPVAHLDAVRIRHELKKLWLELKQASVGSPAYRDRWRKIDRLLDQRLDQKGAHPADCSCHECWRVVADVLARRADPRDVASVEEFGPLG